MPGLRQVMGTAFFGEDEVHFATLDRAASVLFFALMGEVQWTSIEAWLAGVLKSCCFFCFGILACATTFI